MNPLVAAPVGVILDTDMGNDVDDIMALSMLHNLERRGHCELLAVTVSKDHELAGPFVDALNTFHGKPDLPVGVVRDGVTRGPGKFLRLIEEKAPDGSARYPHDLVTGKNAPEAVRLLRKTLAARPDQSVVIAQVGFSTNLARLLESPPDELSELSGSELVRKKVRLLSLMAGAFRPVRGKEGYLEYNVVTDLPAAQRLAKDWPTPRVWTGYEIGIAVPYPKERIKTGLNYRSHHPLKEACFLYENPLQDRPTWDPVAALVAVRPEAGYTRLSPKGTVTVDSKGLTTFVEDPKGLDRYLMLEPSQAPRLQEAVVLLSSEPPG